jgi:hypothetical protein
MSLPLSNSTNLPLFLGLCELLSAVLSMSLPLSNSTNLPLFLGFFVLSLSLTPLTHLPLSFGFCELLSAELSMSLAESRPESDSSSCCNRRRQALSFRTGRSLSSSTKNDGPQFFIYVVLAVNIMFSSWRNCVKMCALTF